MINQLFIYIIHYSCITKIIEASLQSPGPGEFKTQKLGQASIKNTRSVTTEHILIKFVLFSQKLFLEAQI